MVLTILDLKEKYKNYSDIRGKIARDVKKNILFPVVRGVYGPLYLSFEYALSFHNLIPERVVTYTNATFNKRKFKKYKNIFGYYTYQDVPKKAFSYCVTAYYQDSYVYFIASPEKALCDMLYILSPVKSVKALKSLLFDDLRIDMDAFEKLNKETFILLSKKYISNNINLLMKIIEQGEKLWQSSSKW